MKKASFLVLCAAFVTFSSYTHAARIISSVHETEATLDEQLQIGEIAEALQFYFDEIGQFDQNDNYVITNPEALQKLVDQGDTLAQRVQEIYFAESAELGVLSPVNFAKCVAGKFADSYGSIARAFLKGEIFDLIKTKNWSKAAKLMFNVLKAAGKSVSAASLAVEAGVYGWQCRGKW